MIARLLAVGAGAAILAAVAHVNITVTGGYGTPHSWVTIAVAGGVAVGSLVSPGAWSSSRWLAVCLVISMVCGEAYQLLSTAERLVKGRELDQAPLRENQKEHAKASKRVNDAKAAIDRAPAMSKRLEDANAAKAAADRAAVEKSAERGCRENCRQLLQAQVDAAAGEVDRARAEIDKRKAAGERELEAARAALAAFGAPVSATPLADRIGVPAWVIDLVTSALGSIAANGLACCLLMFGAHQSRARVEIVTPEPLEPSSRASRSRTPYLASNDGRSVVPRQRRLTSAEDHAARFAIECLRPGGEAELDAIRDAYGAWPHKQFPKAEIARALARLFDETGISVAERDDGRLVAVGVSLKEPPSRALVLAQ